MRSLLGFIFFIGFIACAQADTIRRDAPANKTSYVGGHSVYNPDCTAGAIPILKLTKKPKHGKVTFQKHKHKLGERAGRCEGTQVTGNFILYQPERGFKGEDTFKVGFVMDHYDEGSEIRHVVNKYVITVK
ncbi:hypothetical protein [Labrenzia sp. PHM005]|uniref:hypothetical protein n=1 Tax=Labrenzia sp. PHM005 TaxID=2590016 RepID=UPI0011404FCB|nr:hypothetical protein [Labrenzia sp. PHM005]QDG77446.1 hypothetical protein FJ695_17090 [Labrenzia sp. PHM005]